MANETPSRPPPLHGKCHLKFPFWFSAYLPYTTNATNDTDSANAPLNLNEILYFKTNVLLSIMISHFCVWRMCKRGAWIFPTLCTKIQARNQKLKTFSNSAIVGCNSGRGRRGGSDHNSGRGQRDMDAHTHTVPCNTRCAIFTKGQPPIRHPCYHLLCTVNAPLCLLDFTHYIESGGVTIQLTRP